MVRENCFTPSFWCGWVGKLVRLPNLFITAHDSGSTPLRGPEVKTYIGILFCVVLVYGCDADRLAKLENENADLKATKPKILPISQRFMKAPRSFLVERVITCDVQGQKCKTVDEFNNLVSPYMSN